MTQDARIGVVGATGAVGTVTMRLLRERGYANVRAFASARSAGRTLDGGIVVEEATPDVLTAGDLDLALFSVGTTASRELVPYAVRGGAVAVDKSAAYRLQDGVPLGFPQALEHGVTEEVFTGPIGEMNMRGQSRPHPFDTLGRAVEADRASPHRLEPRL